MIKTSNRNLIYRITESQTGQDTGYTVVVSKQAELVQAVSDLNQGFVPMDQVATIRHHDCYSDIYFDGKPLYTLIWEDEV